jgi:hypothetical protein
MLQADMVKRVILTYLDKYIQCLPINLTQNEVNLLLYHSVETGVWGAKGQMLTTNSLYDNNDNHVCLEHA